MLPRSKDIDRALWDAMRVVGRLATIETKLEAPRADSASASMNLVVSALIDALIMRRQEQWAWEFLDRLNREMVDVTSEAAHVMAQWIGFMLKTEAERFEADCIESLRSAERNRSEAETQIKNLALPDFSDLLLEPIPGGR